MISQTGLRIVRSQSCKRSSLSWKRVKGHFWGQQVLFGTKFLKFGRKSFNLATLCCTTRLTSSNARLFCKSKQVNLKNKPKTGNLTEKPANMRWH